MYKIIVNYFTFEAVRRYQNILLFMNIFITIFFNINHLKIVEKTVLNFTKFLKIWEKMFSSAYANKNYDFAIKRNYENISNMTESITRTEYIPTGFPFQ